MFQAYICLLEYYREISKQSSECNSAITKPHSQQYRNCSPSPRTAESYIISQPVGVINIHASGKQSERLRTPTAQGTELQQTLSIYFGVSLRPPQQFASRPELSLS